MSRRHFGLPDNALNKRITTTLCDYLEKENAEVMQLINSFGFPFQQLRACSSHDNKYVLRLSITFVNITFVER